MDKEPYSIKIALTFFVLILLTCCNKKDTTARSRFTSSEVRPVNMDKLRRFDVQVLNFFEFFKIAEKSDSVEIIYDSIYKLHPDFWKIYIEKIMKFGEVNSKTARMNFRNMVKDPTVQIVFSRCYRHAFDSTLIYEVKEVMRKYAEYFSPASVPVIVLTYSAFGYNIIALPAYLAISLEKYIDDKDIYDMAEINMYERVSMKTEYLPYDMLKGWILSDIESDTFSTLLDYMITNGKVLYFLDQIFGMNGNDHLKMGYSYEQLQWAEANKQKIWAFFVSNDLIFSRKYEHIVKYIQPAPFTAGLPRESPGRLAVWIGWLIVRSYCKNHECSPDRLIRVPPSVVFAESGFKP